MRRFPRTPEGRIAAEPSRGIPRGARRRASSVERATLAFSLAQTPNSSRVAVDADEREAEPDAPPRIPRAGPGPVATSDGRRRSRRSGRRSRVDGRTEPPRASATPNTRRSPCAFATPSPRPSPRASRNPGPPRTLALGGDPTRSSRISDYSRRAGGSARHGSSLRLPRNFFGAVCRPILLASR